VATRGDQVVVDCGLLSGEQTTEEKSSRVSEAFILVGSVPCQVPMEEKLEDQYQMPAPISSN
jgi:hypothetical protein